MEIKGAEASVEIKEEKVLKTRYEKNYRHPELDERIRDRRTREELKNTRRARKYGVNAPSVEDKEDETIEFNRIKGKRWKNSQDVDCMISVGENVARMHYGDVIHGDLTTSNIMVDNGEVFIIDFGLSEVSNRIEDKAVDIHLLKQILQASHPDIAKDSWENFLKGYREYDESKEIIERLAEVEKRGRYK